MSPITSESVIMLLKPIILCQKRSSQDYFTQISVPLHAKDFRPMQVRSKYVAHNAKIDYLKAGRGTTFT